MDEYLRKATEADMELLFEWANDPEVRENSFSTAQISYEEHRRWFLELLQDESRTQYIYMAGQQPIGQIRITRQGDAAEIGYSICSEWRGRGYGSKMLGLLRQLLKKEPGLTRLTAKVKEGNQASEQAFQKSGYQKKYTFFECSLKE